MLGWVILLFLAMPFVELYLLVQIGEQIGFWPTLWLVLATGLLGGILARFQGVRAWRDVVGALREGRAPGAELVAGALFLVGAALLLTPGVITDAFGFAMMVPPLRRGLARVLVDRVKASDRVTTHVSVGTGPFGGGSRRAGEGQARQTYDVDVEGYARGEDGDEQAVGPGADPREDEDA